jgi:hypothetical protein
MDTTAMHSPLPSAENYWETIRQSQTARMVLPGGEENLDRAAGQLVKVLKSEQWTQLDQALQERVLAELGGLYRVCVTGSDLASYLATPLMEAAAACLSDDLPITDVAQVESAAAARGSMDPAAQLHSYFDRAAPLVAARNEARQAAFLLAPASDAGKAFAEMARSAVKNLELVRVPGQADLMFCREQGFLKPEDLQRVFRSCRQAYEDTAMVPTTSPHARFDIVDWMPLDP